MKILVIQSRPYQAFAGGDGAYTAALVSHLEDIGCDVVGLTSGSTKGRPRPWLRLAYPAPRRGRWYFRATWRLGQRHLAIGPQLVRDTIAFLRSRRRRGTSPFTVAPDAHEQAWIEGFLERERYDLAILTFEAVGAIDLVRRHGVPALALVGFLPIRGYALDADDLREAGDGDAAAGFIAAVRRADRVAFSSRDDCNYARDHLGVKNPIYVGMGFAPQNVGTRGASQVLLFVGNKTDPNRKAVEWFIERVWPIVRARVPDARFRIVGRVGHYFTSDPDNGIECIGEVPALAAEYCNARAVVAPLMTGSAGVKTKVAEAISYGCPLVATSLGVDGGDASQIDRAGFIADDPERFAAHVVDLLVDEALWQEKRAGTAAVFDRLFSREAAYGELDTLIASLRRHQGGKTLP
jgi:glycosyltransferase involved in cell wall biosynthesis